MEPNTDLDDPNNIELSIVSIKGTVCIPAKTRQKYDITQGTKMYWIDKGNGEILLGKISDLLNEGNGGNLCGSTLQQPGGSLQ